ncbi:MAG: tetratricopeptide repeat protein, partial [Planctomycetota bacterium]
VTDQQLKAKVSLEITRCRIAKGDLERAYKDLTKIMTFAEPGPVMDEITLELANVCLKLDQCEQAITVCSQLLSDGPCVKIKQEALEILATAYRRRQEYDKAALALLGQWHGSESAKENRITVRQSVGKAL